MQISLASNGTVIIKTKTEPITLGATVQIDTYTVPGPGEYDVASIQCEGRALPHGTAYFFHTEELNVTYLPKISSEVMKLDDLSNTDILVLDVRSDDTVSAVKDVVKNVEPFYLILMGSGSTPAFIAELGLPLSDTPILKLTRAGLPLEGTTVLAAS
jgi:hypothetical protein